MFRRLLSDPLTPRLREEVRKLVAAELANLPDEARRLVTASPPAAGSGREGYFAHQPGAPSYVIPRVPEACAKDPETGLPVPPEHLWVGYGSTPETYLASGKADIQTLRTIVERSGTSLESAGRILEFGCAGGRMLRWLHALTPVCEVWGTDVTATHIHWCKLHLSPPFHFATTTVNPHLPFEDRYFGLIYAGSVFTHIDDMADSWFLELRRILRPGGRLYVTIHDQTTMDVLDREPQHRLSALIRGRKDYELHRKTDFGMITLRGATWSQENVFYHTDFLFRSLAPYFRVLSVNPKAYYYQTAVLLERL